MSSDQQIELYRFGVFELDAARQQLTKQGRVIRLQPQPYRVLQLLVEADGQLVTREDLRERLWPGDVNVDFDHSLNICIHKLRQILNDDADTPRYIETRARSGYRFLAPVQRVAASNGDSHPVSAQGNGTAAAAVRKQSPEAEADVERESPQRNLAGSRWIAISIAAVVITGSLFGAFKWMRRMQTPPKTPTARRLTSNTPELPVETAAISPDGRYLAYSAGRKLWIQQLDSGEVHPILTTTPVAAHDLSWFPDGTSLVAADSTGVWKISVFGGDPVRVADTSLFASVSPNGKSIALIRERRAAVWMVDSDGSNQRRVVAPNGSTILSKAAWSPRSDRFAVVKHWSNYATGRVESDIETYTIDGRGHTVVLVGKAQQPCWLADGRLVFGVGRIGEGNNTDLHTIRVDLESGKPIGHDEQLASWPSFNFLQMSSTHDARALVFLRGIVEQRLYLAGLDASARQMTEPKPLTREGNDEQPSSWTLDGKSIVFLRSSPNEGTLVRDLSGGEPRLVFAGNVGAHPTPTADGRWWLLAKSDGRHEGSIVRVAAAGGAPQDLIHTGPGGVWVQCPSVPGRRCVYSELVGTLEKGVLSLRDFDPERGEPHEFAQIPFTSQGRTWSLSPDSTTIATIATSENDELRLIPIGQGSERRIRLTGTGYLQAAWMPDGKSWIVVRNSPAGGEVVQVDSQGKIAVLWRSAIQSLDDPTPSPDGRHIAFHSVLFESNAWVLENF